MNDKKMIEKCILCHTDTGYTFDVPIQERLYYVYGCGQLCEKCYTSLYPNEDATDIPMKMRGLYTHEERK